MTTLARAPGLCWLLCLGLLGCPGDDDAGSSQPEPELRPTADGGSGSSAASGLDQLALGEDLTNPEVEALCLALDQTIGLIGDIDAACQAEAWLASGTEADCDTYLAACTGAGRTQLGLELPSPCTVLGMPLAGCTAMVGEMLDCAVDVGAFWSSRTCAEDHLFDEGPECPDQLSRVCSILYGEPAPMGCNGLSESCLLLANGDDCEAIDGCAWSEADIECSGVSTACTELSTEPACVAQPGCTWSP